MELQDYLLIVRKRWRAIVVVLLATVMVGAVGTLLSTKQYQSTTQFFVSTTGSEDSVSLLQGSTFTQQRVTSYTQLLTTPRILGPVTAAVGGSAEEIARQVVGTSPPDTVLIRVAVTDPDPERARRIGEAIAAEFPEAVSELESPADEGASPVKVTVIEPPTTPQAPVSPQPLRNIALALVLGLLLGLGSAVLREILDRTVKTPDDVRRVTDAPLLGSIANDPDAAKRPLIVEVDPRSPRAEAFRALRTSLQFIDAANHPRTIVVTSSLAGEGKSTLTANLALTMSQAGARVCLIEADLRRPKVLSYMGLEGGVGLTDALIDRADLIDVLQPYGGRDLWVLGSGPIPPNPSELLGSTAMRNLLSDLAGRFDYVVIDAPPTLPVTDAVVLSKLADGAIVIARSGVVDREQLAHTLESLSSVGGKVLGLVLNRVPSRGPGHYGAYTYETPDAQATRRERKRAELA